MRIEDAYHAFVSDRTLPEKQRERIRAFYQPYAEGPGRDVQIPVGKDTPPEMILWQYWQQNPGFDKLDESWWPKLDEYALAAVGTVARSNTALAWDVMNEAEFATEDPFDHGLADPAVREDGAVPASRTRYHPEEIPEGDGDLWLRLAGYVHTLRGTC